MLHISADKGREGMISMLGSFLLCPSLVAPDVSPWTLLSTLKVTLLPKLNIDGNALTNIQMCAS